MGAFWLRWPQDDMAMRERVQETGVKCVVWFMFSRRRIGADYNGSLENTCGLCVRYYIICVAYTVHTLTHHTGLERISTWKQLLKNFSAASESISHQYSLFAPLLMSISS